MTLVRRVAFVASMSFAVHLANDGTLGAAVAGACIGVASLAAIQREEEA